MSATVTEMLNLVPSIGQRQATFTFDLIDADSGRPLGELHPVLAPSLSHDTSRLVARTLTGLLLDAAETAAVDPLSDRVRPSMVIGGTTFPLGTYVFTDSGRSRTTAGRRATLGLADLGFVVAQPTETTTSFARGINVGTAIGTLLASVDGLDGYTIEPTSAALGAPIAWPAGTDRGRILEDLCRLGAYLSPFMGNDSTIYVRRSFDPADEVAAFVFDENTRVLHDSISEDDDLLDAPNVFIVVDNANTAAPVVGRYEIPVTAPHSVSNRGFVVPEVADIQGLGTTQTADAAAKSIGLNRTLYQRVGVATPPDPRHDGYDVIEYDDANWLETAWSMQLLEGAPMSHTMQRAYDTGLPA